jgi:hypothetical protein
LRELSWIVANNLTVAPGGWHARAQEMLDFSLTALGENVTADESYHRIVATYLNLGGIDGGYGFFAPNVSDSSRLRFEFHFPDGHIEHDLPHVGSEETAVRLAGLLDEIARTRIDPLREALVKLLVEDSWNDHPGASSVRAQFSSIRAIDVPHPVAVEPGRILYTYDFTPAAPKH